jgi:hypothetical protein
MKRYCYNAFGADLCPVTVEHAPLLFFWVAILWCVLPDLVFFFIAFSWDVSLLYANSNFWLFFKLTFALYIPL